MKIQRLATTTVLAVSIGMAGGCHNPNGGGTAGGTTTTPATGSSKIPESARRLKEASGGSRLPYNVLRDGTIYVQDATTGKLIYKGPVSASSTVVVDPAANAVTVNDQQVKKDPKLDPHHTYRLYFDQK